MADEPNKRIVPEPHTATEFLREKKKKIFDEVSQKDKVVTVIKHSKPHTVIISYDRYRRLVEKGADI